MKQKLIQRLAAELRARKANIEVMEVRLHILFPDDPVSGGAAMFGFIHGLLAHPAQLYGQDLGLSTEEIQQAVSEAVNANALKSALEALTRLVPDNY